MEKHLEISAYTRPKRVDIGYNIPTRVIYNESIQMGDASMSVDVYVDDGILYMDFESSDATVLWPVVDVSYVLSDGDEIVERYAIQGYTDGVERYEVMELYRVPVGDIAEISMTVSAGGVYEDSDL